MINFELIVRILLKTVSLRFLYSTVSWSKQLPSGKGGLARSGTRVGLHSVADGDAFKHEGGVRSG